MLNSVGILTWEGCHECSYNDHGKCPFLDVDETSILDIDIESGVITCTKRKTGIDPEKQ